MTRSLSVWRGKTRRGKALLACALLVQAGLVAAPVELQVVVVRTAETTDAVNGARVKVRDTTKRTGANGAAIFTLDKKAKVRVRVTADNFATESKNIDLTKSPLEEGVTCEENKCLVRIVLTRRI